MSRITVAAATLNQTPLDAAGNKARILEALCLAREQSAELVVFPALALSGAGVEDHFFSGFHQRQVWESLVEITKETHGLTVSLGLPVFWEARLYQAIALMSDGRLHALVVRPERRPPQRPHRRDLFSSWSKGQVVMLETGAGAVPMGDLELLYGGIPLLPVLDEWLQEAASPAATPFATGTLVLHSRATPFATGAFAAQREALVAGFTGTGSALISANLVGNEAGRIIYEGGSLIAAGGQIQAQGERLGFDQASVIVANVQVGEAAPAGLSKNSQRIEIERVSTGSRASNGHVGPGFSGVDSQTSDSSSRGSAWEESPALAFEELSRALVLGLFDYLCKSRSRGFVISLSGGADSAAAASLVALMVQLALRALGAKEFGRRLGIELGSDSQANEITEQLIFTLYQASENSSEITQEAARTLAQGLGARFEVLDLRDVIAGYTGEVERVMGRPLSWQSDDVALQNIQARARGPAAWMIANLQGMLLLSTSNRSECAVGYTTMDGDTSGGLSPLSAVDKVTLRAWLRWLEIEGLHGVGPIPSLHAVNVQEPTAELRPAASRQRDEDDLMPYPVLDAIEYALVVQGAGPVEAWEHVCAEMPALDPEELRTWVGRFYRLWSRGQWKRERYAPGFYVGPRSIDPQTGFRSPLISGAFAGELQKLDKMGSN